MALKVKNGEFYPVGNVLTKRQEMQYEEIWTSIHGYGLPGALAFANKVRIYTEGENAAILRKKDPKLLQALEDMIAMTHRLRIALGQ